MKVHWKTALLKTIVWIAAEIVLNFLGVDTLADYTEFLHDQEVAALSHLKQPALVMSALFELKAISPQTKG